MLEDSQMKQDMLKQQTEDMVKAEMDTIWNKLHKLNNNKACVQASENTCTEEKHIRKTWKMS